MEITGSNTGKFWQFFLTYNKMHRKETFPLETFFLLNTIKTIMLFCQWSSILECQYSISWAICVSELLDEIVGERSSNEEFTLHGENNDGSSGSGTNSSSESNLLSVSTSRGTRSEKSEVRSLHSMYRIVECLGIVLHEHEQMETAIKDISIQWRKWGSSRWKCRWWITSRKGHQEEVTDNLWSTFPCFHCGNKESFRVNDDI